MSSQTKALDSNSIQSQPERQDISIRALRQKGKLYLSIVDGLFQGLPNIKVKLTGRESSISTEYVTDKSGLIYTDQLETDVYDIDILEHSGYNVLIEDLPTVLIYAGEVSYVEAQIFAQPSGTAPGSMEIFLKRYAGATYERVYNVKVTAVHQSNGQTFTQFTTNGYAEFENVPPGIYNLSFSELPNGLVPITPKEVYVYANAHTYKEIQVNNLSFNSFVKADEKEKPTS